MVYGKRSWCELRRRDGSWEYGSVRDGERHGLWTIWHADGLMESGSFVEGARDGIWEHELKGSQVRSAYNWGEVLDKKVPKLVKLFQDGWSRNGSHEQHSNIPNQKRGFWGVEVPKEGILRVQLTVERKMESLFFGKPVHSWPFHEDSKKYIDVDAFGMMSGRYSHNEPIGLWRLHFINGLVLIGPYNFNGMDGRWETLHSNGLFEISEMAGGQRVGTWTLRWTSGLEETGIVNGVKRHGLWTLRYGDGSVAWGAYINNVRVGKWNIESASGLSHVGMYRDGKLVGKWTLTHLDGTVEEGEFLNGKRSGNWIEKDPFGRTLTGSYEFGERGGDWIETGIDGTERKIDYDKPLDVIVND